MPDAASLTCQRMKQKIEIRISFVSSANCTHQPNLHVLIGGEVVCA